VRSSAGERENEAFSDGERALLAQSSETRLDAAALTPVQVVGSKLSASIGNDVLGSVACSSESRIQETEHLLRARLLRKDFDAGQLSGEVIEHDGDVPGKGGAGPSTLDAGKSANRPAEGQRKTHVSLMEY